MMRTGRRAELLGVKLGFPRSRCRAVVSDVLCAIGVLVTKGIPLRIAADREKGRASWRQAGLPAQSLRRHRFRRALRAFICTFCTRVCIFVYVCMCADMIYVFMHVCMYLYIYAFIKMCMCMCMHICA